MGQRAEIALVKPPTRLLDIVGQVRRGELKIKDVRTGIRKTVERLAGDKTIGDDYFKREPAKVTPVPGAINERSRLTR